MCPQIRNIMSNAFPGQYAYRQIPVVPHKAVAEVSKIGNL